MELDNFKLEEYNSYKLDHKEVISKLSNDFLSTKYLGDLNFLYKNILDDMEEGIFAKFFVAYYNDYPVGIIVINKLDNKYFISSGILKEHRGYHLAALLLQEFTEKIFETRNDIDKLYLSINEKNRASQNTALLAGYEKENKVRYLIKRA